MATKTSLIQLVNVGEDKSIHNLNPKTVGKGVSVERTNQKIPSSVTDVQTLCNALVKLGFNDKYTGITAADFADGVITQELNITQTGKIADARALKTLNDTLTTQGQQITQINNNYEKVKIKFKTCTLTSGSWHSYSSYIEYELSSSNFIGWNLTSNSKVAVILDNPSSSDAIRWASAQIVGARVASGGCTLIGVGSAPTSNIDVIIAYLGDE